ncbi:MAG TPA: LUD domain-containing protein, partial [Candidatus Binataceae bacterium]
MSNSERGADFFESSRRGASDQGLRQKLENSSGRHLEHLAHAIEEFPAYNDERDRARKIKQDAIGRLDELLLELKRKLEARNCTVFFAADADEASKYIVELARTKGVKLAVKGKSMTTEEIELNPALKQAGVEVVESDLGEYIVQLRRE